MFDTTPSPGGNNGTDSTHVGDRVTLVTRALCALRPMSRVWLLLAIPIASACAHPAAKTLPENPPLDVPAAPPREVEPADIESSPLPSSAPLEPVRGVPSRPRQAPPPPPPTPKPEPPKAEPARPEPPPADTPKPVEEPPKPPTSLQTTPATAEVGMERGIRTTLARASADLGRINVRALNAEARTQYDTAKSFIRQADVAIRAKNLVFAKNLADKAEALAVQLGGK
jgi:hypothetical protein